MKQVIENMKTGDVQVIESPMPYCSSGELLVKNCSSLISPGTEKLLIEMGKKNLVGKAFARTDLVALAIEKAKREGFLSVFREAMARLDQPMPLGYSSAGKVLKTGNDVKDFAVGDNVACAGFSFASHAEIISVPQELCVKLPSNANGNPSVSFEDASFVMLGGIALQGIRNAQLSFGENVVVVGLGLIGLLTTQIAKAYGCKVVGVDIDAEKTNRAKSLGCDYVFVDGKDDIESALLGVTNGHGSDAVIITAATTDNSPITLAEKISRKKGKIILVGVSGLSLTRKIFWDKELSFTVSKASGPSTDGHGTHFIAPIELTRWTESRNLQEFVRLLVQRAVNVKELVTHRFSIENTSAAYEMILEGTEPYIGVLINYPSIVSDVNTVNLRETSMKNTTEQSDAGRMNVGVIGAGMFTKNIFLPVMKKEHGVNFIGLAAKTGISSTHVGKTFGFQFATSDYQQLLNNAQVGSMIITTRHNLHGSMVIEALKSGKHLFVEKPLCITKEELDQLIQLYPDLPSHRMIMVGFNRRYSSLAQSLKKSLAQTTTPLQILYRVNAGFVARDHWTQDSNIGGGRIIGEVCHMIDLLQYFAGCNPVEVTVNSIHSNGGQYFNDDNIAISLLFSNGSLGTILYTALGSKAFSRERIEIYGGGMIGVIDDFRQLEVLRGARRTKKRLMSQDMGYRNEVHEFLNGDVRTGKINLERAIITTLTTFCAVDSLRSGKTVAIPIIEAGGK